MEMSNPFLDLADTGKNAWWRYVLGVLLVLMMWMIGTVIIITPVTLQIVSEASPFGLALALVTFAPMLLGPMLVTRWLHGRPVATLVGPERRLNWRRIGVGALLWLVLAGLATLVDALLHPGQYMLNPAFLQNLPLLLVGLFLIPLQTSAEEVFFRGYLLQATGRLTRNGLVLSVINGVVFTLPHLANPEAESNAVLAGLNWFVFGFFATLITLRSGSLDYALGIHAVNNLFGLIIAGYEGGALPALALFVASELDAAYALLSLLVAALAASLFLNRLERVPEALTASRREQRYR